MVKRQLVLPALVCLLAASCTQPDTADPAAAKQEVEAVLAAWTQALLSLDADRVSDLFSLDDQLVNWGVGDGERYVGRNSYQTHVAEFAQLLSENHVVVTEQQIGLSRALDAAWFSQVRDYRGVLRTGGELSLQGVRVTGTLEKQDGIWRIVSFHHSVGYQSPAADTAGTEG